MARIAIIIDQMFEDSEFRVPYDRLRDAGHQVDIVGLEADKELHGKKDVEQIRTTHAASDISAADYDALVIPGGYSPDKLRTDHDMVRLTREIFNAEKPLAAVCHAGWLLVEADIADGRTVTSWPSIKTDLINAGARWIDREVVEDGNLITSRKPDDLEAFSKAIMRQLEQGPAERLARAQAPAEQKQPGLH